MTAPARSFCSLSASHSVEAIDGAVALLHGGRTCAYRLEQGMSRLNGNQGSGNAGGSSASCTGLHSSPVPRRTTDCLENALEALALTREADLFVVLTGCLPELIGEDTGAEVRRFRKAGWPVVHVDLPGFEGTAWHGHERLMRALTDQLVEETFEHAEATVNLWSSVPYLDPFWSGDLLELQRLLEGIGVRVNVLFGVGSSVAAWRQIPSAALNLVVSPWVGVDLAEHLQARFGTPYLHWPVPPIGIVETSRFLRAVATALGHSPVRTEAFLRREEGIYLPLLQKGTELFVRDDERFPQTFHCVADCHMAVALERFLSGEMGMSAGVQFAVDQPSASRRGAVRDLFRHPGTGEPTGVALTGLQDTIAAELREMRPEGRRLILGSFWEEPLARELGAAFVPVSAPVGDRLILDRTYLGPRGGLRLLEDLWNAVLA